MGVGGAATRSHQFFFPLSGFVPIIRGFSHYPGFVLRGYVSKWLLCDMHDCFWGFETQVYSGLLYEERAVAVKMYVIDEFNNRDRSIGISPPLPPPPEYVCDVQICVCVYVCM